jgi:predicted GH43/DUF377 family glycosyl hydrolase
VLKIKNNKTNELFHRHPLNPIISINDIPYNANSVFNAGAVKVNEKVFLLMRVEDRRGISHLTLAKSKNGISNWKVSHQPTVMPNSDEYPEEVWGIEDPRIIFLEEKKIWAITYTAYSKGGPLVSLMTTNNFQNFTRYGPVMPPEDKDAALFPIRFDGRWAMIHRPVSYTATPKANIWISFSPDLKHWGDHQVLIKARKGSWWDANKIGLSPPPLRTNQGWLILYHGVKTTASGIIYRLGLALLDLTNPRNLIARSDEWIFSPKESYEIYGDVDKVVFPCGWIQQNQTISLYYGCADSCISLATANLAELLEWLKKHNSL